MHRYYTSAVCVWAR